MRRFGTQPGETSFSWQSVTSLLLTVAILTVALAIIPDGVVEAASEFASAVSPWIGIGLLLLIIWSIMGLMVYVR